MAEKSLDSDVLKEVFAAMSKHFEWDTEEVPDAFERLRALEPKP